MKSCDLWLLHLRDGGGAGAQGGQVGSRWSPRWGSGGILDPHFRRSRIGDTGSPEILWFDVSASGSGICAEMNSHRIRFIPQRPGAGSRSREADGVGRELDLFWVWSHLAGSTLLSHWRAQAPSAGVRGSVSAMCRPRGGATVTGLSFLLRACTGPRPSAGPTVGAREPWTWDQGSQVTSWAQWGWKRQNLTLAPSQEQCDLGVGL